MDTSTTDGKAASEGAPCEADSALDLTLQSLLVLLEDAVLVAHACWPKCEQCPEIGSRFYDVYDSAWH